jgi:Concanavalin A-like lectin/glucanases superfamily
MNEDCKSIACPTPKNPVQDFANQYSLSGVVVSNLQFSTVINGVTITIPDGTITVPIPSNPTELTVQSCSGPITLPVPHGSSPSQIQQIGINLANMAAQAQAHCIASSSPVIIVPGTFSNQEQTYNSNCTNTIPLVIIAPLPGGISQVGNSVIIKAGMFTSNTSQDDADNQALNFLTNFMNNLFMSGGAVCGVIDLLNGLIAYYKFDEAGGSRQSEVNNGLYELFESEPGADPSAPGIINNCLWGAQTFADRPYLFSLNGPVFNSSFSIACWARIASSSGGPPYLPNQIIFNGLFNADTETHYVLYIRDDGFGNERFHFEVTDFGGFGFGINVLTDFDWHHYVCVYDSVLHLLRIYKDSVLVSVGTGPTLPLSPGDHFTAAGTIPANNLWDYMFIDESGFWTRALNAAEVGRLYNGGAGLSYPF